MISQILVISMLIAGAGGLIRGITGFGGSLVMTPLLTLMFEPKLVVPTVLLLEAFAAAPMLRDAARVAHYRVIAPICLAAFATLPLGGYMLVHADPNLLRRGIAAMVALFCVLLLRGVRYRGARKLGTSIGLGALCGVLLGGTGIGGPPVILYLLSGPDSVVVTRANLTLCVVAISIAALLMLWVRGVFALGGPLSPLAMAPCFYGGIIVGSQLFRHFNETRFRQFTVLFLLLVSVAALFAR